MSTDRPARLVHRYAIRLSDPQLGALRDLADASEVPISVLLRVAIRWIIAAGPGVLDGVPPAVITREMAVSSDDSTHLVHRYAIRLSRRQRTELLDVADACDVRISVLLRLAIRWIIAAGPEMLTFPQPPGGPPEPAVRFDTAGDASSVDASGALQ